MKPKNIYNHYINDVISFTSNDDMFITPTPNNKPSAYRSLSDDEYPVVVLERLKELALTNEETNTIPDNKKLYILINI